MLKGNNITLDAEDFKAIVGELATEAPRLLKCHPRTAHLGAEIEHLALQEALQRLQFTVAVVGRMSSGKSTLLNTLFETTVLPTGVNETTATVNWLWHGAGARCQHFNVHWNDGQTTREPLENTVHWIGKREENANIGETKYLEFFINSPFLRDTNFVDTPGTQTNEPGHEETTREFIATQVSADLDTAVNTKLNAATLEYGGFASAILYVLGAGVAKAHNVDFLEFCGISTRLPGAYPENSIAVFQKWDLAGAADEDPLAIAAKHRERLKKQLAPFVFDVLPTCPPFATAAKYITSSKVWQELAESGARQKSAEMKDYISSQDRFHAIRGRFVSALPPERFPNFPYWPVIRAALRIAHAQKIDDGDTLRETVNNASGLDELKHLLKTRFIDKRHLLLASSILTKIVTPCEKAQSILREIVRNRADTFTQALEILNDGRYAKDLGITFVKDLLREEHERLPDEIEYAEALQLELARIQKQAESGREDFDADIISLKTLTADISDVLSPADIGFLKRLFGESGKSVRERLGMPAEAPLTLEVKERVEGYAEYWADQAAASEDLTLTQTCEHAAKRLHDIADYIQTLYDPDENVPV